MDDSVATPKGLTIALVIVAILEVIMAAVILLAFPETIKQNCLTVDGIAVAITGAFLGFRKCWVSMWVCVLTFVVLAAAIIWYAMYPPEVPPTPVDDGPTTTSPPPSDPTPASDSGDIFTITEIDPTKDSVDFVPIDNMEENQSTDESDYFPTIGMQDCRHLFISFTEEFQDSDMIDIQEYRVYILDRAKDWNIEKLKSFINQQFEETYQSVEDYSAQLARGDPNVGKKINDIEALDIAIKQARATNEPTLSLYQEYADRYLELIDIAPRGEYYLQLARPYEEGILRMRRAETSEKNAVFLWAANAVVYFRTALTYKNPVGDSVSDIFYRIAKIYHYIGDTPGLYPDIRSYFYRVSEAYMTLAAEREVPNDTYYGYSTYYGAMVYHKLAIITAAPDAKRNYLESAEQNYEKADKDYALDDKAKEEIKHALADIDTRKRQGY